MSKFRTPESNPNVSRSKLVHKPNHLKMPFLWRIGNVLSTLWNTQERVNSSLATHLMPVDRLISRGRKALAEVIRPKD